MIPITVWKCTNCNKLFRTPNRHYCKKNPELKNCFTCKHLKGWNQETYDGYARSAPPEPDCAVCPPYEDYEWNIETIKRADYNMQCSFWEEGKYDWISEINNTVRG